MRTHLDTLKLVTETEGRDFSALTISYKAPLYDTGIPSPDGSRRPFSGEPQEIASDIRTFAVIGVHELIFDCRGQSIAESIERLQCSPLRLSRSRRAEARLYRHLLRGSQARRLRDRNQTIDFLEGLIEVA